MKVRAPLTRHLWKWLLPLLVVAEIVLVRLRLLSVSTAVGILVALEVLLFLVTFRQALVAIRRYRHKRSAGADVWTAFESGLEVFLPAKLARVAASEPKLWYCLWRWLTRQVRPGDCDFTYHRKSILGPLLVVLLFTTPAELLLIEILLPWAWLRWLLFILALYAFFWVWGLYASLVALPHTVSSAGIRLAYGILAQAHIAFDDIVGVELSRRSTSGEGLKVARGENAAFFAVGGATDVTFRLRNPRAVQGWLGPTRPVTAVHLAADEPERLAHEISKRLEASKSYS